jgi:hypothetical protein
VEYNPVRVGEKIHTGYPVIVVAEIVIVVQATEVVSPDSDILSMACIIEGRNNEIKHLIAKYFSTFLHELTVISTLQTNADVH